MRIRYEIRTTNEISKLFVIIKKRDNFQIATDYEELLETGPHIHCFRTMNRHIIGSIASHHAIVATHIPETPSRLRRNGRIHASMTTATAANPTAPGRGPSIHSAAHAHSSAPSTGTDTTNSAVCWRCGASIKGRSCRVVNSRRLELSSNDLIRRRASQGPSVS